MTADHASVMAPLEIGGPTMAKAKDILKHSPLQRNCLQGGGKLAHVKGVEGKQTSGPSFNHVYVQILLTRTGGKKIKTTKRKQIKIILRLKLYSFYKCCLLQESAVCQILTKQFISLNIITDKAKKPWGRLDIVE